MPDLLNYLEMVESREIIEKRIEKNLFQKPKEEEEFADSKISKISKKF